MTNKRNIFLVLIAILFLTISVNAFQDIPTIVNGHVYNNNMTYAANEPVKITCNNQIINTHTNSNGYYSVEFFDDCFEGSIVKVYARNKMSQGIVKESSVLGKNIAYINLILDKSTNPTNLNTNHSNNYDVLKIKSLFLDKWIINRNDNLELYVKIKNQGPHDAENVHLRISIKELNIRNEIIINNLSADEQRLKILEIPIEQAKKKSYVIEAKLFDEHSYELEEIEFSVR